MSIPFVEARHYAKANRSAAQIKWIVVHSMEIPEKGTTAESCARMFATTSRPASAHYCVDNNSVVQCVRDKDIAYAARGGNSYGLHIEHAGFASQRKKDWLDEFSQDMLVVSAKLAAKKAARYGIPIRKLSVQDVRAGKRGFCGHIEITNAFKLSTHWDPGPDFPMDAWLVMVKAEADALKGKPWSRRRLAAAAAAIGLTVGVFNGVTFAPDPAPKPTPKPTVTVTATPTPTGTQAVKPTPKPTPKPSTAKPTPTKRLRAAYPGYRIVFGQTDSPNVERVQRRLKALGYYTGSVDGDFGPKTKAAVVRFQKPRALGTSGIVGPKTWRALFTY